MKKTKEVNGITVPYIPTVEKTDSRCVMLKQKEYDELVRLSKDNRSKEIIVKYDFRGYNSGYTSFNVSGDFELKGTIRKQILNICKSIEKKFEAYNIECSQIEKAKTKFNTRNDINDQFMELPWYKRLFFKKEYIN